MRKARSELVSQLGETPDITQFANAEFAALSERNQSWGALLSFVQGCRSLAGRVDLSDMASGYCNSGFAISAVTYKQPNTKWLFRVSSPDRPSAWPLAIVVDHQPQRRKTLKPGEMGRPLPGADGDFLDVCRVTREQAADYASFLLLAFCAAQRLRCASAMRLRASGLSTRIFRVFIFGVAEAFLVLRSLIPVATLPVLANKERACVSRAISASI